MVSSFEFVVDAPAIKLGELLKETKSVLKFASPWIKTPAASMVLGLLPLSVKDLQIYTRLDLRDFIGGSSDIEVFRMFFKRFPDLKVRCIPNLHAKFFVFDDRTLFLTSGNLTSGGLSGNVEAGIIAREPQLVQSFNTYISDLFKESLILDSELFERFVEEYEKYRISLSREKRDKSNQEEIVLQSIVGDLTFGKRVTATSRENNLFMREASKSFGVKLVEEPEQPVETVGEYGLHVLSEIGRNISDFNKVDPKLLEVALTHPTYLGDAQRRNAFFRLRLFGAHVLEGFFTLESTKIYKDKLNQELHVILGQSASNKVKEGNCSFFQKSNIEKYFRFDFKNDPGGKDTIIRDIRVSIIGAIFLGLGSDFTNLFKLDRIFDFDINILSEMHLLKDPKTALQEVAQKLFHTTPTYEVISSGGLAHNPTFEVQVRLGKNIYGKGMGGSKGKAEDKAAANALVSGGIKESYVRWLTTKFALLTQTGLIDKNVDQYRLSKINPICQKFNIGLDRAWMINKSLTHPSMLVDKKLSPLNSYISYSTGGSYVWMLYINTKVFLDFSIPESLLTTVVGKLHKLALTGFELLDLKDSLLISNAYTAGREEITSKIKEEVFYSLIYVKYLLDGYEKTTELLDTVLGSEISKVLRASGALEKDNKSKLQELTQVEFVKPNYSVLEMTGLQNKPTFTVGVYINGVLYGIGKGKNVAEAGEEAAGRGISKFNSQKILTTS